MPAHTQSHRLARLAGRAGYRVKAMAALAGLSSRQFRRAVRRLFGVSPRELLARLRLVRAERLLLAGCCQKQVAGAVGYDHTTNFCRFFRACAGTTAVGYVRRARPGGPPRGSVAPPPAG
jgi:AraC-like DNA-binding protein